MENVSREDDNDGRRDKGEIRVERNRWRRSRLKKKWMKVIRKNTREKN